jgi:2-haloacid dehalogenase
VTRASLEFTLESAGIAPLLSAVISVDRAETFKPNPKCYELVVPALGVSHHDVLFVSSNGFDVAAAKNFGFRVAWIERGGGPAAPANSDIGPRRILQASPQST